MPCEVSQSVKRPSKAWRLLSGCHAPSSRAVLAMGGCDDKLFSMVIFLAFISDSKLGGLGALGGGDKTGEDGSTGAVCTGAPIEEEAIPVTGVDGKENE